MCMCLCYVMHVSKVRALCVYQKDKILGLSNS